MRYLCFVKMDESDANPPKALMDAMGEHVGEGFASGVLVDAGGLYGKADAVEFRVSGGNLAVTDMQVRLLDADRFVGVVTGWETSREVTRGHVDELLERFSPDPPAVEQE